LTDVSYQNNLDKHGQDSDERVYCWLLPRSSTASSWVFQFIRMGKNCSVLPRSLISRNVATNFNEGLLY